jgi:hypothetical protein
MLTSAVDDLLRGKDCCFRHDCFGRLWYVFPGTRLGGAARQSEQSHRGALGLGIDISAVDITPSADLLLAVLLTWSHEHTLCL